VRAYLLPQIRFYLDPAPWSTWQYPIGRTWYKTLAIWYDDAWLIVWNTLFSIILLIRWLLNFLLVPLLSESTLKLLIAMSFGLQNVSFPIFHFPVSLVLFLSCFVCYLEDVTAHFLQFRSSSVVVFPSSTGLLG
jgi:hypothetical protein